MPTEPWPTVREIDDSVRFAVALANVTGLPVTTMTAWPNIDPAVAVDWMLCPV
jgi:hypothetical protein